MHVRFLYVRVSLFLSLIATTLLLSVSTARPVVASPGVTLTFWTWVPDIDKYQISLFEKAYPNIQVKVVNAGNGGAEYTKLRTALKAGSGAPDDVQIEYQMLPTFEATNDLVDLSKYGAAKLKSKFAAWTWKQVSRGKHVYGIPQDAGPMGMLYRRDVFAKYHLKIPTTWAQYAADARALHKANSSLYMTDMPPGDPGELTGLMWQAGSHPFHVMSGKRIKIHINDAPAKQVVKYWGSLISSHVVNAESDFTTSWYQHFTDGTYATWITAAWGPVFLSSFAKTTSGEWGAAVLPQWNAKKFVSGNWGGSTTAVTSQSSHPKEAAELALFINSNRTAAHDFFAQQFFWPVTTSLLKSSEVQNQRYPFYGNQRVGRVFARSSAHVNLKFEWSPFQDYVYQQMTDAFGSAASGNMSYTAALDQVQSKVVDFAQLRGYTVQK